MQKQLYNIALKEQWEIFFKRMIHQEMKYLFWAIHEYLCETIPVCTHVEVDITILHLWRPES